MNILSLLRHRNPENHLQAIRVLANSGSPYAIELLRIIATQTRDIKMKEACKRAAQEVRKGIRAAGKAKNRDLSIHVEILMTLAMLTMQDLDSVKESKQAVVRAYGLDMDLLSNADYQDIAQQVFHSNLHEVEDELRHFTRQNVKHHRTLKSGYPIYMYLIDIPVMLILGAAVFGIINPNFGMRVIRYTNMNSDEINWEMVQIVGFILTLLVAARIFYLLYEQWEKKKLLGWEKEARRLAIDNLESEIKKLNATR